MSVWVAGGVVVGTIGAAVVASNSADKASDKASKSASTALAFDQQKYDDWNSVYGDIQNNLSSYYNSLTPDQYEAQGLQLFQQEHQNALANARTTLAQRGIEDSGIAAQLEIDAANSASVNRAVIRQQAPGAVAAEKSNFLQIGLGQNPGDSLSTTLSAEAARASNASVRADAAEADAIGTAIQAVGTGLSDYFAGRESTAAPASGGTT